MTSSLSYSTFDENDNISEKISERKRKNKTIKKRRTQKVENFLNGLQSMDDDDDSEGLANFESDQLNKFNPPPNPQLNVKNDNTQENMVDSAISPEAFSTLNNSSPQSNYQNYYNTYVPYYNNATNNSNLHGSKDELMKKLNYMIHLLEENKDEKTNNVTEELVLYLFLGVFTIFVVDSFARAGKYTR